MSNITLRQQVPVEGDVRTIEVHIRPTTIVVHLDYLQQSDIYPVVRSIGWDDITDVELLSDLFEMETVRTFKVLVGMLGNIHAKRALYEALA